MLATAAIGQVNHIENAARFLNEGQLSRAEAEARIALKAPVTRALALAMLGTIRLQEGKSAESITLLNQALAANPNLIGARTTLGEAYVIENKPEDARKAFAQALKRDPNSINARFDLANLECSLQNFQRSLELAAPIVPQLSQSEEGLLLLAKDYGALGRRSELDALPAKWHSLPAASDNASIDFAGVLASHSMPEEAKNILADTETRVAGHPSAAVALRLGQAYLALSDFEDAQRNAELAHSLDATCVECDLALAQIAERQGIREKALSYLVQAKKLAPENPEVLFEFGRVCLLQNLLEDALPALEKAVQLQPDRDQYVYVLASANVQKGNLTQSASLINGLLTKHPDDALLNYAIGSVYYLQGKYPEAEAAFKKSLGIQPDQVAANYYLSLTYDTIGEDDKAVPILRELLKTHPEHVPSSVKLGSILARQQQYGEAEQHLQRAISLDPSSAEAHYQLGLVLGRLGRKAESEDQLAQWRKLQAEEQAKHEMHLRLLLPD